LSQNKVLIVWALPWRTLKINKYIVFTVKTSLYMTDQSIVYICVLYYAYSDADWQASCLNW